MSYAKWQLVVRTLKHMVSPWHPPRRPSFQTDNDLLARQLAQRDLLGDLQPVGNRESTRWGWDGNGSPIDDDFTGPIG